MGVPATLNYMINQKIGISSANNLYYTFISPLQIIVYVTAAKRLSEIELFDLSVQREPSHR